MSFNLLYNNDPIKDHLSALTYLDNITKHLSNENVFVDEEALFNVLSDMRMEFPHVDGLDKSSCFKKAGHFLTSFIAHSPIKSTFDLSSIGPELHNCPNHANVMIGLQISIDGLDGASIFAANGGTIKLDRIKLSKHSYIDLIEALHRITPGSHYKLVTVLLEQLVYKTNPSAQYDPIDI